mgnify:CR=1 FL=1
MATLTGNSIASTYTGLLSVSGAVGADTVEAVTDGAGTSTSLSLSQQRATITLGSGAGDDFIVDGTTLVVEGDNNRVGIGTDSPARQLHVHGGSGQGEIHLTGTSTGVALTDGSTITTSGLDLLILNRENGDTKFYNNGSVNMTIDSAGDVGIGTDSPGDILSTKGGYVTINGTSDNSGLFFSETTDVSQSRVGGTGLYGLAIDHLSSANRLDIKGIVDSVENHIMTIQRDGNVGIGDTSPSYQLELSTNSAAKPTSTLWTVPSDERLKDDIVLADLDKCYDIIQNLPLKRFKWKEDVYTNDQTDDRSVLGWIAQDVQSVFPKSVKENNFRGVSNNDAIQSIEAQDAVEWLDKPSEDNTKDEIKAWMDSNSLAYNSGDTKTDLIAKIPELKQEAIESVVGVDETYKLEIEDCLSIDADQIFRAMFGAIQKLQAKVEALESK